MSETKVCLYYISTYLYSFRISFLFVLGQRRSSHFLPLGAFLCSPCSVFGLRKRRLPSHGWVLL